MFLDVAGNQKEINENQQNIIKKIYKKLFPGMINSIFLKVVINLSVWKKEKVTLKSKILP